MNHHRRRPEFGALIILLAICCTTACEPTEPSSTSTAEAPVTTVKSVDDGIVVDCAQKTSAPELTATWLETKGGSGLLENGFATLAIQRRTAQAGPVEVALRLEADGRTIRVERSVLLRETGDATLRFAVEDFGIDAEKLAYAAQLVAQVLVRDEDGHIVERTSAEPVFVHFDANRGAWRLTGEDELALSFSGGDLKSQLLHEPIEDDHFDARGRPMIGVPGDIGVARYAGADDLVGDPDDQSDDRKELRR